MVKFLPRRYVQKRGKARAREQYAGRIARQVPPRVSDGYRRQYPVCFLQEEFDQFVPDAESCHDKGAKQKELKFTNAHTTVTCREEADENPQEPPAKRVQYAVSYPKIR